MTPTQTLVITYGAGGGAAPATSPNADELSTFTTKQKSTGSLTAIGTSPTVDVQAQNVDGAGAIAVSPTTTVNAATATTLTFTYTGADGDGLDDGEIDVAVPGDWTAPQKTSSSTAGYVTATGGTGANTITIGGTTIEVSAVTLGPTDTLIITYKNGVAPNADETSTFNAWQKATAGGTLTGLADLTVDVQSVPADDGSGTIAVSPASVNVGTTTTLTFTYTPTPGTTVTAGEVDVTVPASWTAPSTDNTKAGYVTATGGTTTPSVALTGAGPWVIAVSGVTLGLKQQLTIVYGAGGGANAATAPASAETSTFTTQQKATTTLTDLA
ncbi:MAG: hypothetical protein ACRDNS_15135, partial [Trebonia sp.]